MKVKITNMACGHCRLKIESELRSAGFNYIDFDMLSDTVELREDEGELALAKTAIRLAGYTVDSNFSEQSGKYSIRVYTEESYLIQALSTVGASLLSYNNNIGVIKYSDAVCDLYDIFDAFGIEHDS